MEIYSNVILGTGNYQNIRSGNTVSVNGDGGNAWEYYGPAYKKLAPRLITYTPYAEKYKELQKMKDDLTKIKEYINYREQIEFEYIKSYYETRLKDLDVQMLLYTLNEKFGNNIILLCHESPDEFCHRRLIADYVEIESGIHIPEIKIDEKGNIEQIQPIRYINQLKKVMK